MQQININYKFFLTYNRKVVSNLDENWILINQITIKMIWLIQ